MWKSVAILLLCLIPSSAWGISPLIAFDGGEMMSSAQVGSASGTSAIFPWAEGDTSVCTTYAWGGLSSFCFKSLGSSDNLAAFRIDTCASPDETLFNPCPSVNRLNGAQEVAFAFTASAAASADTPILSVGNRICEDPPVTSCNAATWDRGNRMVYFDWTTDKKIKVEAFKLGAAIPTPTPGGTSSTCKSSDALPLIGGTEPFSWLSTIVTEDDPSANQLRVRVQTHRYDTPTVDETIDCAFDYSGDSFPTARLHFLWDRNQALNVTPLPVHFDTILWAQSSLAQAGFILPTKDYWLADSATSAAGTFLSETESDFAYLGAGTRLSAVTQNPFNTSKYLQSTLTCGSLGCNESFTTSAASFAPNSSGVPAAISSYPVGGSGQLVALQTKWYLQAPSGGSDAGTQIGVTENGIHCSPGKVNSSTSAAQVFTHTIHRLDGVNDTVGSTGSCDASTNFRCGETGYPSCPGLVHDYAHVPQVYFGRLGGTNSSPSLAIDGSRTAYFAKEVITPDTPTATVTRTFTLTPTATHTPTITLTPINSFTPTITRTPTATLTFTKTNTPNSTFTPSPTFEPTIKLPSDPPVSVCRTQNCILCAHSQRDLRIVVDQACRLTSPVLCPNGRTVIIDRSYNTDATPSVLTDTLIPTAAIGGLGLCSNLTLKCVDDQTIKFTGPGSGLHPIPGTDIHDVTIEGCRWDGTDLPAGESTMDLFGVPNLTVRNTTILGSTPVAITFGGPGVSGVLLDGITSEGQPKDAGGYGTRMENCRWGAPTPTVTP